MAAPRPWVHPGGMRDAPGFTLVELTLVLLLTTALLAAAVPSFIHARDVLAVRAARAELVAAAAAARAAAILAGGATLIIDRPAGAAWVESPDGERIGAVRRLAEQYRVELETAAGDVVTVRYDALGLGRLASTSLRLRRGAVSAAVTISAYGRVRS
jgi:type II secretory pathway pseudopilin PulG